MVKLTFVENMMLLGHSNHMQVAKKEFNFMSIIFFLIDYLITLWRNEKFLTLDSQKDEYNLYRYKVD